MTDDQRNAVLVALALLLIGGYALSRSDDDTTVVQTQPPPNPPGGKQPMPVWQGAYPGMRTVSLPAYTGQFPPGPPRGASAPAGGTPGGAALARHQANQMQQVMQYLHQSKSAFDQTQNTIADLRRQLDIRERLHINNLRGEIKNAHATGRDHANATIDAQNRKRDAQTVMQFTDSVQRLLNDMARNREKMERSRTILLPPSEIEQLGVASRYASQMGSRIDQAASQMSATGGAKDEVSDLMKLRTTVTNIIKYLNTLVITVRTNVTANEKRLAESRAGAIEDLERKMNSRTSQLKQAALTNAAKHAQAVTDMKTLNDMQQKSTEKQMRDLKDQMQAEHAKQMAEVKADLDTTQMYSKTNRKAVIEEARYIMSRDTKQGAVNDATLNRISELEQKVQAAGDGPGGGQPVISSLPPPSGSSAVGNGPSFARAPTNNTPMTTVEINRREHDRDTEAKDTHHGPGVGPHGTFPNKEPKKAVLGIKRPNPFLQNEDDRLDDPKRARVVPMGVPMDVPTNDDGADFHKAGSARPKVSKHGDINRDNVEMHEDQDFRSRIDAVKMKLTNPSFVRDDQGRFIVYALAVTMDPKQVTGTSSRGDLNKNLVVKKYDLPNNSTNTINNLIFYNIYNNQIRKVNPGFMLEGQSLNASVDIVMQSLEYARYKNMRATIDKMVGDHVRKTVLGGLQPFFQQLPSQRVMDSAQEEIDYLLKTHLVGGRPPLEEYVRPATLFSQTGRE